MGTRGNISVLEQGPQCSLRWLFLNVDQIAPWISRVPLTTTTAAAEEEAPRSDGHGALGPHTLQRGQKAGGAPVWALL